MADCGLLNLATCLPSKFFEYIATLVNAPLQPLLYVVKGLLSAQVELHLFVSLWAIIIYMLSMFYALLIVYSGFNMMVSGYDVTKREKAKEWLKNIVIMIILVQSSFFIYELVVQLSAIMTSTTLTLVDPNFFLLTLDNLNNIALEIVFFVLYIIVLILTIVMLIARYAIVCIGVVLFPIGIFFYFIAPLRPYGILILHFLAVSILITFFDAIILVGFSKLIAIPLFADTKILVMITAFSCINVLMLFLMFFSIIKAALNLGVKVAVIASKLSV